VKRARRDRVAWLTADLALDLARRMPACCCEVPSPEVLAAVWPLAARLEKLERQAARDKKRAKAAYRKLQRRARLEVAQLIASQDGAPVPVPDLLRTVPMSAGMWRVALVPGAPVPEPAREAEAA
jgi:hypothetical protein